MAFLASGNDYPLVDYPMQFLSILALYFLFVFDLGPLMVQKRNPVNLKAFTTVYNLTRAALNAFLFVKIVDVWPHANVICSPPNSSSSATDLEIRTIHFHYFLVKLLDLLDTILLILRKENYSFYHLYQRVSVVVVPWATFALAPGGAMVWFALLDAFVSTFVHFYDFLSLLVVVKNPWWRRSIAQMESIQQLMLVVIFYIQLANWNCGYPKTLLALCWLNSWVMVYLVSACYVKNYQDGAELKDKKNKLE